MRTFACREPQCDRGGDGLPRVAVTPDVVGAFGRDDHEADAAGRDRRLDGGNDLARLLDPIGRETVHRGQCREVDAVGSAEQELEVLGLLGLWEKREDAAAVVVEHDERRVDAAPGGAQEAVGVVEEAQVADQRDRRSR